MREFRAMCGAVFGSESALQTVLATTRGRWHEVLPPELGRQRFANEFRAFCFGVLVKTQVVVVCDLRGMPHHCGHDKQIPITELPEPVFHGLP